MGRVDDYRTTLAALPRERWPAFLTEHSHLPGPRGNLELAAAVADLGDRAFADALVATGDEYLTFCGVLTLGSCLAAGEDAALEAALRGHAGDPRWRVREAVAMALQRVGDAEPDRLRRIVLGWCEDDSPLVLRAAAAGICEPRLLRDPSAAALAVEVCRRATASLAARPAADRRDPDVRVLRQGLGYCWSVAVAADPAPGLAAFADLRDGPAASDPDVAWIVRQNLAKKRLARLLEAPGA